MLLFGRSRSRRGLASALIGEIAAIIDGMEGFEEVRKLEDMEIGADEHLDELVAFTAEVLGLRIQRGSIGPIRRLYAATDCLFLHARRKPCRAPARACGDQ